tara:strand:- start:285 stop:506 length:222 start_codon:yes stop_codon:yes gene_type:complete
MSESAKNRRDLISAIQEVEQELDALDRELWLQADEQKGNKNRAAGKIGMKDFLLGKIEMLRDELAQLDTERNE